MIEASTRQKYHYLIHTYLLPEFAKMRMIDILPSHVREWVARLTEKEVGAPTIRQCKVILNAVSRRHSTTRSPCCTPARA